jgi:uncharacterized protein YbcI
VESIAAQRQANSDPEEKLQGGPLLSAISTASAQLMRASYGRGPIKAKTYALDDMIVCVLRGSGFTPLEKTMLAAGHPERVVAMREGFQTTIAERYKAMIEELTDRKVVAFLSQAHLEPDISLEVFFIDRPLEGFGSVEVIDDGDP